MSWQGLPSTTKPRTFVSQDFVYARIFLAGKWLYRIERLRSNPAKQPTPVPFLCCVLLQRWL